MYEKNLTNADRYIISFLGSGSRLAVNIFLLIGVYFLAEKPFKSRRIIDIWMTVFIYSVPISLVMYFIGESTLKVTVRAFIPILLHPLWFASVYISLLLIIPYLDKMVSRLSKRGFGTLILILFVGLSFESTIKEAQDPYAANIAWFCFVYVFVVYMKRVKTSFAIGWYIFTAVLLYAGMVLSVITGWFSNWGGQWLADYKSIPNFICAWCIFRSFEKINIPNSKIINRFASYAFPVYIFHQIPAFYPFLWEKIICVEKWTENYIVAEYVGGVLVVYIMASFLEYIRRQAKTIVIKENNCITLLSNIIDDYYDKLFY